MTIKLLISDIDGTAVQYPHGEFQSTWDAIGFHVDWEAWQDAIARYSSKPHLWEEWGMRNKEILKGHLVQPILDKILPPPYTPGFAECMKYAVGKGVYAGFVSGGSHFIAEYMIRDLNLHFHYSNVVHVNLEGRFTGTGTTHVFFDSKGQRMRELQDKYGVSRLETLFVGDHENDIYGWAEAGVRVGMNLKRADLRAHVDHHFTDFFQLKELLETLL